MFRASYSDTGNTRRWSLHGRLAVPWVNELRSCWKEARERAPLARVIVDLKEVTFIDEAGKEFLAEMLGAGAELIVTGVEHQHLLAKLDNRTEYEEGPPVEPTVADGSHDKLGSLDKQSRN